MNQKLVMMLNSCLVGLVVGFKEIANEIDEGQGLHETSLNLRMGDMHKIFNEACSTIEEMNSEVEVQD